MTASKTNQILPARIKVHKGTSAYPSSFVAAFIAFLIVQFPLQMFAPNIMSLESANYNFVLRQVESGGSNVPILCMGDSLVKIGISPAVLGEALHDRALNLAVIGSRPMATYSILKRVLSTGQKPKAVIVDFEPGIIQADPRRAVHESAEFYNISDCIEAATIMGGRDYVRCLTAAVVFPIYRLKHALSNIILAIFRLEKVQDRGAVEKYVRNWQLNKGQSLEPFRADPVSPPQEATTVAAWKSVIKSRAPWICDSLNLKYLTRFMQLAEAHSIRVYWLITPMHPAAQAEMESAGVDASYTKFAAGFVEQFPNLTVIDGRHSGYRGDQFIDAAHFHRGGSLPYSSDVGHLIASGARDSWVQLQKTNAYRDDSSFEDVEQSAQRH